jgi:hypothetical protein
VSRNLQEGLAEYANIHFLTPQECRFAVTPGGFLSLECGDKKYAVVGVYRSFPLTLGDRYLSVRDEEDQEIGIIDDLLVFPSDQADMIRVELERRYFTPIILCVEKLKEEFGYIYWEVETDRGPRRFTTRSSHDSVMPVSDTRIIILDVDGNRFEIPDYRTLDPKSAKQVEALI